MSKSLFARAAALGLILAASLALQSCAAGTWQNQPRRYYNPEIYPGGLPYSPNFES